MAMIYQALELRAPPGRYRICGRSDENKGVLVECCQCEGGHESEHAARKCPDAAGALAALFSATNEEAPSRIKQVDALVAKHGPSMPDTRLALLRSAVWDAYTTGWKDGAHRC